MEMPVTVPGTGGSLYKVLWVESTATISKIKTAYQSLVKVYHPNLSGNGRDLIKIYNAYERLLDPTARAVYDLSLASRRRTRTTSFGCSDWFGFHATRRWGTAQCWYYL
ncbi:hypothetical protein AB3S75_000005 [Citrus x aurantiifolia]